MIAIRPNAVHLILAFHWFDQVASGEKTIEYRAPSPNWQRVFLGDNPPDTVIFHRGYTARTITRRIVAIDTGPCPYPGWKGTFIRIHFQPEHKGDVP